MEDSIKSIRPGYGLPPKLFNDVIGKTVNRDIEFGKVPVLSKHIGK